MNDDLQALLERGRTRRSFVFGGTAVTAGTLLPRFASAQSAAAANPPNVNAVVGGYMKQYSVPGLSLSFRRGSRLLYSGTFGVANESAHRPVQADSLFRIASNSKAFTAAAVLLLAERSRLTLADRVFAPGGILGQYSNIGAHRDWLHAITVHNLLTHTAGGWGNENDDPMFEKSGLDQEELIRWTLDTHALKSPPGQKYDYSNFGYCILGRVIERAGGQPYARFVREHVMAPAGIQDMSIATHQPEPHEVSYYGQSGENPYTLPITRMDSHGGWISTADDMALFMATLFSPQDHEAAKSIVSAASLATMTQGTSADAGYACGLAVNPAGNAWHAGSLAGTMSLMVHTKTGMSWAAVLNTRSDKPQAAGDLDSMLWRIAESVAAWHA